MKVNLKHRKAKMDMDEQNFEKFGVLKAGGPDSNLKGPVCFLARSFCCFLGRDALVDIYQAVKW